MWFVFPQIKGLGFSDYNILFGIENLEEAQKYYNHPILGQNLLKITTALLKVENKTALEIMGKTDARKLKSCITLFCQLPEVSNCFILVLQKYYDNQQDSKTLEIIAGLKK